MFCLVSVLSMFWLVEYCLFLFFLLFWRFILLNRMLLSCLGLLMVNGVLVRLWILVLSLVMWVVNVFERFFNCVWLIFILCCFMLVIIGISGWLMCL